MRFTLADGRTIARRFRPDFADISRDGRFVVYTSNFGGSGGRDSRECWRRAVGLLS